MNKTQTTEWKIEEEQEKNKSMKFKHQNKSVGALVYYNFFSSFIYAIENAPNTIAENILRIVLKKKLSPVFFFRQCFGMACAQFVEREWIIYKNEYTSEKNKKMENEFNDNKYTCTQNKLRASIKRAARRRKKNEWINK